MDIRADGTHWGEAVSGKRLCEVNRPREQRRKKAHENKGTSRLQHGILKS